MKKAASDQTRSPYVEALKHYLENEVSPFDVPGHHMGNVENDFTRFAGHHLYEMDVNAPVGLDNLAHPTGVIREAERLMAEACGADDAFFLVNGTTVGILAMILTAVKAGEKILLPRNVHKSVVNALILSGAIPEYIMPEIDPDLEIANQPTLEATKKAILRYPSAKAILVINPTYFGSVSNLSEIVRFAHAHGMAVLCDEAHGAHYYFHYEGAPMTAMDAGADLSSVSFHKTGGSLTQSSVLLSKNNRYSRYEIQTALNMLTSTSPSTILIASLDAARQYMVTEGKAAQEKAMELVDYAQKSIRGIPGFFLAQKEEFRKRGSFDYDKTKLIITFDHLDINGFDLYQILKKDYGVQMELSETYAVLAIIAIGTKKEHIDHLADALKDISKKHYHEDIVYEDHHFDSSFPYALTRPRVAFNAPGRVVPLEQCAGEISREQVMIYPPGIPFISPGEAWTKELVERVGYLKRQGISIHSSYPEGFEIIDQAHWKRLSAYKQRLADYYENKKTTALRDGYSMPFEGEAHLATVVLLPFRSDTWRKNALPAREAFRKVIFAIAEHEKVIVGIHPCIYDRVISDYEGKRNIEPIKIRYNDSWARDNMPIFLKNGKKTRCADFRFNAWGGDYDGLYRNYQADDRLASAFARRYKLTSYREESFVLEGGSVAVDGEGTLIATEACLLSPGRNPTLTRGEIEENLKQGLGVEKIVWVPHGIYNDETDEHIDNMVAFVKPGVVIMAWTDEESDPQYEFCKQTYEALAKATDAKGRHFEIHKLPVPSPYLSMTEEEASTIRVGRQNAIERLAGNRLAASYVNFYLGKDFVIAPAFGVKEDEIARAKLQALFPERKIHQINTREILLGGGNIHCITQQIPEGHE